MRKVLCVVSLVFAVLVWFAVPAHANGSKNKCDSYLGYVLNSCADHPTEKNKMEVGVGLDIPLYISDKLIIDQETRIDLNAGDFGEWSQANIGTYTVFKPQLEEGILQTAWNKIASLFGR